MRIARPSPVPAPLSAPSLSLSLARVAIRHLRSRPYRAAPRVPSSPPAGGHGDPGIPGHYLMPGLGEEPRARYEQGNHEHKVNPEDSGKPGRDRQPRRGGPAPTRCRNIPGVAGWPAWIRAETASAASGTIAPASSVAPCRAGRQQRRQDGHGDDRHHDGDVARDHHARVYRTRCPR